MKNFYILILFLVFVETNVYSQAIRKNFLEMTDTEKIDLVNAFYQLRTGPDLINDLANFHGDFANFDNTATPEALDIHVNLPDEPERDIFFAWHRRQVFELEQAMQDINPNISMPYWDSSVEQSVNSPLWDQNFLGQFDVDWGLNRFFGNPAFLPVPQDLVDVQAITNFLMYSNLFERGEVHTGAHRWIGGAMPTSFSPRDPAFYLHHSFMDKLWSEWEDANQSSAFQMTSMLRYDGTYAFDGVTLPLVNPNDIVDEKTLGTFYADNQLATLEDYTVSNTYNAQENFYYQFTIEAGSNFIVPSGNDCKFESVNEIVLQPGFEAVSGSSFEAKIDDQSLLLKTANQIVRNQIPFSTRELEDIFINQSVDGLDTDVTVIKSFPNPFSNKITIQLSEELSDAKVVIFDMMGKQVKEELYQDTSLIEVVNLYGLPSGVYVMQVLDQNSKILVARRLIKM